MKQWIKDHTETIDDPKFCSLTWEQRGIFHALMLLAGQLDHKDDAETETGRLDTVENISFRIRCELCSLQVAVDKYIELRMVHVRKGIIYLTNYTKRQMRPPSAKTGAIHERVKRHRANLKRGRNEDVTPLHTEGNEDVTTLEEKREEKNREEKRIEESREDAAGAGAPPPPDPPKAVASPKATGKPKIAASPNGERLLAKLKPHFEALGRDPPAVYKTPEMAAAFEVVIEKLAGEFGPLTDKAFEKGIDGLDKLLGWYQGCLKHRSNGAQAPQHGGRRGTNQSYAFSNSGGTRDDLDPDEPTIVPIEGLSGRRM